MVGTFKLRTDFAKLNDGWDARGGAPIPEVRRDDSGLRLTFFLRAGGKIREYDRGELFFRSVGATVLDRRMMKAGSGDSAGFVAWRRNGGPSTK